MAPRVNNKKVKGNDKDSKKVDKNEKITVENLDDTSNSGFGGYLRSEQGNSLMCGVVVCVRSGCQSKKKRNCNIYYARILISFHRHGIYENICHDEFFGNAFVNGSSCNEASLRNCL